MSDMNGDHANRVPKIIFVGVDGVLVRFAEQMSDAANAAALAFHKHIENIAPVGIREAAPSLTAVYLKLDLDAEIEQVVQSVTEEVHARDWFAEPMLQSRLWTIPCSFDGPQLSEAAQLAGVNETQAVAQITSTQVRVLTLGFAPGQPYLGNLESHWNIARMDGVAPRVPARALVVAVAQLIIFANETPTGWRHIGQSAFQCFDQNRAEPFAFQAGDRVQFVSAARSEIDALWDDSFVGARLEVVS